MKTSFIAIITAFGLVGCGAGDQPGSNEASSAESTATSSAPSDVDLYPEAFEQGEEDWGIVREKALWVYEQGLDSLPMGVLVARIGESFAGTPYAAHTLEVPGEEHLVVELNGLDCVTFVESALAIARLVKSVPPTMFDDQLQRYRFMYSGILQRIRYRDGELDGYPSRLHYFSEWITDNDRMGIVEEISADLGGVQDPEPIDFMTTHSQAYRQLGESPDLVEELRSLESELNRTARVYIPEDKIAEIADQIRTGDIIAATSTVGGLDVAHTGIAIWVGDELRLLHAPLSNGVVQISERTLATRIQAISGQDGVMVARPSEVR